MEKLQKICQQILAGIGVFIFAILTFYAWRYTVNMPALDEVLYTTKDVVWKSVLFVAAVFVIVFGAGKLAKHLEERKLHLLAIILSCGVVAFGVFLVNSVHVWPIGDQRQVFMAALQRKQGIFPELEQGQYFTIWPFQLGLTNLYAFFYQFTKAQVPEVIQTVQAVFAGVIVYLGFRITGELFHDKRAECLYLVLAPGFVPLYLYVLYLYGETFGVCAALLGIWCFLVANREEEKNTYRILGWLFLAGVAIMLTYIVRSALIIVWIAMVIIQILLFFRRKRWLPLIMLVFALGLSMLGQRMMIGYVEKQADVELGRGMPIITWIAMGLQDNPKGMGQGSFNDYNINLFKECGLDREETSVRAKQYIGERFSYWSKHPGEMLDFFKNKVLNQWNEPSYGAFTMTRVHVEPDEWAEDAYYGKTHDKLYQYLNCYQAAAYLAVLGYFVWLFGGRRKEVCYLPGLILIGGFLFSVIWEAKSRYIYPYLVMALPCVAGSIVIYYDRLGMLVLQCSKHIKECLQNKKHNS